MATERNVVDFKIHNLTEEQFQELKAQGKIDPNAVYCTPDESLKRNQITNCITEIPQDIKLEISGNTVTLKAGSVYYVPNGVGVFEKRIVTEDKSRAYTGTATAQRMILITNSGNLDMPGVDNVLSGGTDPQISNVYWYDTATNVINAKPNATTNYPGCSLALGIMTVENGAIKSIDQVFNGFGYIGSTVFVLPGVKALIPDGRNADGTLKNINMTVQSVLTKAIPSNTGWHYITINTTGTNFDFATNYYTGTELPSGATSYSRFYNTAENLTYNVVSGKLTQTPQFVLGCYIDHSTSSPYKINSMKQATAFHAVDYGDFETLSETVVTNNDNAVHKTGAETIADPKTFTSEIKVQGSANAYRIVGASYGSFWRQDEKNLYLMLTNAGDPTGNWNNLRPFILDLATGAIRTTTPSSSSNDTQVATTAWANNKFLPLAGGTLTGALNAEGKQVAAGYLELKPTTSSAHGGFIDFHYAGTTDDYTSRIMESASGQISVTAKNGLMINGKFAPSMPSEKYTTLSLGASGNTYTAPADGWYCISKECTGSGQYLTMTNITAGVGFTNSQGSGGFIHGFVPVRKGDTLKITYTANGTLSFFRFTYAEGAKHLA